MTTVLVTDCGVRKRQNGEGRLWLDAHEDSLGSGERSVSQVSNLARLYALDGDVGRSRELHDSAVDRVSQELVAATSPEQRQAQERIPSIIGWKCRFWPFRA